MCFEREYFGLCVSLCEVIYWLNNILHFTPLSLYSNHETRPRITQIADPLQLVIHLRNKSPLEIKVYLMLLNGWFELLILQVTNSRYPLMTFVLFGFLELGKSVGSCKQILSQHKKKLTHATQRRLFQVYQVYSSFRELENNPVIIRKIITCPNWCMK